MAQPIRLTAATPRRRLTAPDEPPLPTPGDLIARWAEEQARYRP